MPPTQAGIIPRRGSQYQNTSDTDSVFAVKDTADKSGSCAVLCCSQPQMALHWLLISFPTASSVHAEKAKSKGAITDKGC